MLSEARPPQEALVEERLQDIYIQAEDSDGIVTFGLKPLRSLVSGGLAMDDASADPDEFDMRWMWAVHPGYRLDGTCGRVVVRDDMEGSEIEAFVAPTSERDHLALVDSLGTYLATLTAQGSRGVRSTLGIDVEIGGARALVSFGASESALVTDEGRLDLARVFPDGRWYARPAGVRLDGSDLVLVHTCDLLSGTDGSCGVEMSADGVPLADPMFPYVTHLAVRVTDGGRTLSLEPFGPDWHESVFDGVNLSSERQGSVQTYPLTSP